jgi:hypothetical protein
MTPYCLARHLQRRPAATACVGAPWSIHRQQHGIHKEAPALQFCSMAMIFRRWWLTRRLRQRNAMRAHWPAVSLSGRFDSRLLFLGPLSRPLISPHKLPKTRLKPPSTSPLHQRPLQPFLHQKAVVVDVERALHRTRIVPRPCGGSKSTTSTTIYTSTTALYQLQ